MSTRCRRQPPLACHPAPTGRAPSACPLGPLSAHGAVSQQPSPLRLELHQPLRAAGLGLPRSSELPLAASPTRQTDGASCRAHCASFPAAAQEHPRLCRRRCCRGQEATRSRSCRPDAARQRELRGQPGNAGGRQPGGAHRPRAEELCAAQRVGHPTGADGRGCQGKRVGEPFLPTCHAPERRLLTSGASRLARRHALLTPTTQTRSPLPARSGGCCPRRPPVRPLAKHLCSRSLSLPPSSS